MHTWHFLFLESLHLSYKNVTSPPPSSQTSPFTNSKIRMRAHPYTQAFGEEGISEICISKTVSWDKIDKVMYSNWVRLNAPVRAEWAPPMLGGGLSPMDKKKLKASTVLQLFSDCRCERNNRTQMKILKKSQKQDVFTTQLHFAAGGAAASVAIKKNTGVGHFHITFHLFYTVCGKTGC